MEAAIKYLGDINENYNRFGRVIPKQEMRIDVAAFFNCNADREQFIIGKLLNDKRIFFKLIKPAGDESRKVVEKIEKAAAQEAEVWKEAEAFPAKRGRKPKE